ncbi:hypothetical protein AXG93_2886s1270 [Marchantia polymorpha subsp. ruderalis]|uniref:Agenet-like domain-containing protein n=1 Tax=Marchantia polymorpha subsp. ruderalis TaxID=1480154 RepID=A0A176WNM9_MARPO|nr:hypothetical protein AXG93_2886s1270 [Marchantia polymorpha subsp. ruderalis]
MRLWKQVRQREKGLRGSWFPAVVVGVKHGKRVVEYDELLTEDRRRKLTEIIPVGRGVDGVRGPSRSSLKSPPNRLRALIRPLPPSTPDATELTWKSGLWVDVRHNDGVDPTAFGRLGESKPAAVGVQYPPDAGVEYKERAEDTPPFESGLGDE